MSAVKKTSVSSESGKLKLQDLKGKIFVIPYYQRGYRWTEKEAKKLFSDLVEFTKSGESEYCLQPIVLQAINEIPAAYKNFPDHSGKNCLRVVDGQQRLTTIAILMNVLGCSKEWDIYYIAEGKSLSEILEEGKSQNVDDGNRPINDYFRNGVWNAFDQCEDCKKEKIKNLLESNSKTVSFLRYEIPLDGKDAEGHQAFLRLNDGKTPLTSSELIKALYMVNVSVLGEEERMEVAKEWEIIENTLRDEQFWLMFNSKGLSDTPTRIDLLFALVMNVRLEDAKANPRIVFEEIDKHPDWDLYKVWQAVLRCFWWMKSCYADVELFNYLCWVREFTDNSAKKIYDNWRKYPGSEDFKKSVVEIIQNNYKEKTGLEQFNYDCDKNELRKLFVLLNVIDCNHNKERFRFDLYKKESWDIEHIDSQTPNELPDDDSKKEWLRSSFEELSEKGKAEFRESFKEIDEKDNSSLLEDFENKANKILELWGWNVESSEISDDDKNMIGNLALLNTHINRSYKNAIFPAKRKVIKEFIVKGDCYVPPCTAKAFMKFYTETTSKITYWLKSDFDGYANQLNAYFKELIDETTELQEKSWKDDFSKNNQGVTDDNQPESQNVADNSSKGTRLSGEVSFEKFMEKYHVVIPKIQRLYVQGRQDSYGKKCLSSFASRLVGSVTKKECCHLDFIYGIDRDNGKVFEPLDGQQRLTTLFLLAWLCGKAKDSWVFKYESRRATECFVLGLLKNPPPELTKPEDFDKKMEGKKNSQRPFLSLCSDAIRESDWFLSAWEEDAGIAGMLEMLDSLYCKLLMSGAHEFDFTGITFFVNYLDTTKKSYDQIFLKMNSRGKPLTRWERIKAVLDQYASCWARCPYYNESMCCEAILNKGVLDEMRTVWQESLNNTWQEQLWKRLQDGNRKIDTLDNMMLSVVELALRCVGYDDKVENTFQLAQWFDGHEEGSKEFYTLCATFFSSLEDVHRKDKDMLGALTPAWETTAQWPDFTRNDYYKPLLAHYAAKQSVSADWMRVVWNIVENSGVSKGNFPAAYRLVKELSGHKDSILEFLAGSTKIESIFEKAREQVDEEREKARQLQEKNMNAPNGYSSWWEAILSAEKTAFFKGSIRFLFNDGTGSSRWRDFETKFENAKKWFDVSGAAKVDGKPLVCKLIPYVADLQSIVFSNNGDVWKREILLNDKHQMAVAQFLMQVEASDQNSGQSSEVISILAAYASNKEKFELHLFRDWTRDGRGFDVVTNYARRTQNPNVVVGNNVIYAVNKRNDLLNQEGITVVYPYGGNGYELNYGTCRFFKGIEIDFEYSGKLFRWYGQCGSDVGKTFDVYLWGNKNPNVYDEREGCANETDEKRFYCFDVVDGETKESFLKKLQGLISDFNRS